MEKSNHSTNKDLIRRQRQHELLIALIQQQDDLELMDAEGPRFDAKGGNAADPAKWLDRNRRVLAKYQSLVNSSITLDALLDSEGIQCD
ncbi:MULTISPECIES: hypothetical protein [Prochlorococcus]|uniref:Uncharacterized protein n=1 Tax=Prochlorococcus marinus (strain SARG / CCMP1375 / SS120) TaxID=167539 RepID=Q7VAW2_PROMA|nr:MULTISPECIES: hypothetical protein [Prochlorococcus]AAQ00385.1 Predicted protein [Prochlorococcus marinus subsp. marinus str. CCMP1375]KGG14265.1 hypothetical protein EV04_0117 [Prochlorococcus marinus str. LG]KGG22162.1 hypothetical protein EV08_0337 [Prochlorococcus marinus str. SS2]KGG24520.1 hypothetical protein EV09_0151 [Prochlorococcus marinus str. SS35]KGG33415.1 hypothetical protein EV10_0623 [Prochlorococcus marinus str. SS51]